MTRSQAKAEREADEAAERARRARSGQRIKRQTIAQALRLKALLAGIRARARAA
jgi:hypothetical protein